MLRSTDSSSYAPHDLTGPLNVILMWAELLGGSPDPEQSAQGLRMIERSARRELFMVGDLLDYGRMLTGKLRLRCEEADLVPVIHTAVDAIRCRIEEKRIDLACTIDPDLPLIVCDPNRVEQVIWNILSNAVKYTPDAGKIDLDVSRTPGGVQIRCRDTGKGIEPGLIGRILDKFQQDTSPETLRSNGLGLGLAISKEIVRQLGGAIRAESPGPGKGSTFIVELPQHRPGGDGVGPRLD